MAKFDSMLSALEKLYAKRDALDKQIVVSEKKLVAEAKSASKPAAAAKKPAKAGAKKPAKAGAKKPAAKKVAASKLLMK